MKVFELVRRGSTVERFETHVRMSHVLFTQDTGEEEDEDRRYVLGLDMRPGMYVDKDTYDRLSAWIDRRDGIGLWRR